MSTDLTCSATLGGSCVLSNPCSNYGFLWEFSFQGMFENNENYFIVPLAAFATDESDNLCHLWINYLETSTQT